MKNKIQILVTTIFLMTVLSPAGAAEGGSQQKQLVRGHHSTMVEKYTAIESEKLRIVLNDNFSDVCTVFVNNVIDH